jgi:hypothetical protein
MIYNFKYGLRFELGDQVKSIVPRFLQSIDRARAIAKAALERSDKLSCIVWQYGEAPRAPRRKEFSVLRDLGFPGVFERPCRTFEGDAEHIRQYGVDLCRYWYESEFSNEAAMVDSLLWASVSTYGEIRPKTRWLNIYIVDFQRRIAIHIYDDRGMDVVAMEADAVRPLYNVFSEWLFDFDRARMNESFA